MTAYEKPQLDLTDVAGILSHHFGAKAEEITTLEGGNLSSVFSFTCNGIEGIIKFSDLEGAYQTERYVSNLLNSQGVPYAKCLGEGKVGPLAYSIMERIHDFKERLIGAYYFKGMDGLRFYAKMGWKDAYTYNRNFLLNLTR